MEFDHKNLKCYMILITFALTLAWVFRNLLTVRMILGKILECVSPFILGLCIAFVLNLILRPLERGWMQLARRKKRTFIKKLKRPVCLLISVLLFLGIISIIFFVLLPQLETTFSSIFVKLPNTLKQFQVWWMTIVEFFANHNVVLPVIDFNPENIAKTVSEFFINNGDYVFDKTMGITMFIFSSLVKVLLALVFALYVLAQKEKLGRNAKKLLCVAVKEKRAERILYLLSLTSNTFSRFVSGQVTEALILGSLCFIGMSILRLPYAFVISVVICFSALIPIFGAWIGAIIGTFLIVFVDPIKAVWFLIFLLILQQVEGNLIYPKVVGSSVGLPGLWVLVAVTVGGSAFGMIGMLFAVPIFSVLYALIDEIICEKS